MCWLQLKQLSLHAWRSVDMYAWRAPGAVYRPGVQMHAAALLLALVMKPAVQCALVCKLHGGPFYSAGSACFLCGTLQVVGWVMVAMQRCWTV
jgi:hypothetical protein